MVKAAQEWKPTTSPKLVDTYSTKIEWARKIIPKLKKEVDRKKEKEELR